MSFIARCPACQTWYKVVPDQLRISEGWVRCGQCGDIFDASQQLIEAESELPVDPAQADDLVLPHQPPVSDTALHEASKELAESAPVEHQFSSGERMPRKLPVPERDQPHGLSEASWDSAVLLIKPSAESEAEAETVSASESVSAGTEPCPPASASSPAPVAIPVAEPVSFMRAPDVRSDAGQKTGRLLWAVLSVFLLLGLLLQGLYRERDQLATWKPEIKPALQSFCEVMGCRILPLQHVEALALDSATFHQVDPETFQMHFVVKNKTRLALALPAVELSLTDLNDQPVIRRVLTPAELGAQAETVPAAGEWSATAYLRVKAEQALPRALGYRLLVFYP